MCFKKKLLLHTFRCFSSGCLSQRFLLPSLLFVFIFQNETTLWCLLCSSRDTFLCTVRCNVASSWAAYATPAFNRQFDIPAISKAEMCFSYLSLTLGKCMWPRNSKKNFKLFSLILLCVTVRLHKVPGSLADVGDNGQSCPKDFCASNTAVSQLLSELVYWTVFKTFVTLSNFNI